MGTKARELDNHHDGDRGACPICSPRRGIPMDVLWERTHATVGRPFVEATTTRADGVEVVYEIRRRDA